MRVKASPPRTVNYPRVADAWRLLLGAAPLIVGGVAHADASVPPCPNQKQPDRPVPEKTPTPTPTPPIPGGMMRPLPPDPPKPPKPPEPSRKLKKQPAPPVRIEPDIDGGFGRRVSPPDAPRFVLTDDPEGAIVIHAHGPDEPCKRRT
jgi:hypothetical protein